MQPDVKGASLVSVEDSEPEVIFDLDSTIPEEGWFLADLEQPSIWKGRFGTRSTTEEITEKPTEEQETTDKFQRFRFGLGK